MRKKLIWDSLDIGMEETDEILQRLKRKSEVIYGPKLFEKINLEIRSKKNVSK